FAGVGECLGTVAGFGHQGSGTVVGRQEVGAEHEGEQVDGLRFRPPLGGCPQCSQGAIACCHGGLARPRMVLSGWATVLRGRLVVPLSLWGVPGRDLRVFTCLELRAFIAGVAWQEGPRLRRAGEDYPTGDHVSGAGPDAPFGASASAHGPVSVGGGNGASRAGTNTGTRTRAGARGG